jgi:hypothetical protein
LRVDAFEFRHPRCPLETDRPQDLPLIHSRPSPHHHPPVHRDFIPISLRIHPLWLESRSPRYTSSGRAGGRDVRPGSRAINARCGPLYSMADNTQCAVDGLCGVLVCDQDRTPEMDRSALGQRRREDGIGWNAQCWFIFDTKVVYGCQYPR